MEKFTIYGVCMFIQLSALSDVCAWNILISRSYRKSITRLIEIQRSDKSPQNIGFYSNNSAKAPGPRMSKFVSLKEYYTLASLEFDMREGFRRLTKLSSFCPSRMKYQMLY
jgi:hypothetical protein